MINLKKYKKDNKLIIDINDNVDYYLKKTKLIKNYCDKNNLILEFKNNNNKDLKDIEQTINIKDKKERYEFIYDKVCSYLDKNNNNYCEFIDDICIRDRINNNNHKNGCCECNGRGKCKYLINSICTLNNCISCKLFTCKTLKEKGIEEKLNNYVLLKYFFNQKQKDILRFSYWTPKEIIIDRLINNKYVRPK